MKCFKIDRVEHASYGEDYSMVVIAKDELHAERRARLKSRDFRQGKLRVKEIDMDEEQCVLVANNGS